MTTMTKKIKVAEQSPYEDVAKQAAVIISDLVKLSKALAEKSDAGVDFQQDGGQSMADDIADAKILMKRVYSRIVKAQDLNVVAAFKTIARTGKSVTVGSVTVGQETANVVLSFYSKLSAKDKKKFSSIKSLDKIVDMAFSGKTVIAEGPSVTGTWEDIVDSYAKAVLGSGLADAVDNAVEQDLIDRSPWGGGDDIMDFMPAIPGDLRGQVESFLDKIGKTKVITDCDLFVEDTGENASTYGHYLAMQQMGHGVGLGDYGYDTTLPNTHTEVGGSAETSEMEQGTDPDDIDNVEEAVITLYIDGTFNYSVQYDDIF